MPLDPTALASELKTALQAANVGLGNAADAGMADRYCAAIANAVVAHIIANALVTVTVSTTGTAAAQTGGGTGVIT